MGVGQAFLQSKCYALTVSFKLIEVLMRPTLHYANWPDLENWLRRLSVTVSDVNTIVGVARGGAVIATALSHLLPNKHLRFATRNVPRGVEGAFYDFSQERAKRMTLLRETFVVPVDPELGHSFLVVDDVATFGDTLECVTEKILAAVPNADIRYACYAADAAKIRRARPSILCAMQYELEIDNEKTWVTFPWILTAC